MTAVGAAPASPAAVRIQRRSRWAPGDEQAPVPQAPQARLATVRAARRAAPGHEPTEPDGQAGDGVLPLAERGLARLGRRPRARLGLAAGILSERPRLPGAQYVLPGAARHDERDRPLLHDRFPAADAAEH